MATAESFNRSSALKQFDETKAGVRGLIESGINTLPAIFRLPAPLSSAAPVAAALSIPTVDLSLPTAGALVCAAARDWGFLQLTNHGIPLEAIAAAFSAGRSFHELPAEDRSHYYTRGPAGGVSYISNIDLFRSSTASWRDTLQISMGPNPAEPDRIPAICRAELLAWDEHVIAIGRRLLRMLSEGMGADQQRLEELTCLEGRAMVCHYYPPSPEPDLTVGLADHSDPGVLTVLVQDQIGGLQVKRTAEDGEISWVDVKPVEGAIVINVGDLLQIISNDKYKVNIQEALVWKEKIELVIDQHQDPLMANGNKIYPPFSYNSGIENEKNASSSDRESQGSPEDDEEEERHATLMRRTTIGNGPPDSLLDWTREIDLGLSNQSNSDQVFSRKHWRLIRCQNGLRIFEELLEVDYLPRSCSRAMKAVGVVEASCEAIFELVMSMDGTRFEWDCSFQYGSLVEEVDGHTAILYHRLQHDWFPAFVWPRDLCYVRYWRRNDDGSYVVLFQSREHTGCGPQPGFVRAHIESGGFNISPLKSRNGRPRTQVQHLMQIDLKGWGVGYSPSFQQHCLLQMLNSVAGLREWFSQADENHIVPRIPVMANMTSDSVSSRKERKTQETSIQSVQSLDQMHAASRHSVMLDEYSDEDEDYPIPEPGQATYSGKAENDIKRPVLEEETSDQIDLSSFSGNLRRDDRDNTRDCWRISDGNNFRVRSKHFLYDKTKIPAGKHLMELVAVDWFKDAKRMDHVARRQGCAVQVASEKGIFSLAINVQVPGSTHYSMVFYFVTKQLVPGSLLQRFVDGDDEFRNSRFKLIPSVPKGSWIVRQSVGSTPCLLGKAVDCTYIRGPNYLEIDVDIGSSTVANGVLGLVCGVITTLVVDMAFLVQANTTEELPERLIGAVRVSHVELSSAVTPKLQTSPSTE